MTLFNTSTRVLDEKSNEFNDDGNVGSTSQCLPTQPGGHTQRVDSIANPSFTHLRIEQSSPSKYGSHEQIEFGSKTPPFSHVFSGPTVDFASDSSLCLKLYCRTVIPDK
jgi:hypothetical protein